MEKRLLRIWNNIRKSNDEIIKTQKSIANICVIIKKDYSIEILALIWDSSDSKEKMKEFLRKKLINEYMKGYILIFDATMTRMNPDKEPQVCDAVVRQFYTSKETFVEAIIYKNKKIIERINMNPSKNKKYSSEWNL
jgi:hypothetical protein